MNEQNVDGGYDFKLVKEGNDLECPICLLLLREAMGTQCRHLLCKVCLEKLQRSSDDNGRDLICQTCKEKIDVNQEYHYSECQKKPVGCLMGCGVQVPREKMEEHLDKVCSLAEVECEFPNAGCTAKVPRMDLKKHLVEFTQIHMSHLCNKLNQSQKEMEQLKRTSALSQKKVDQLENGKSQSDKDLEEMKRINAKSQNEIKQMNIQIEELKEAYNQSQNEIKQIKETSNQSQNEIEQLKIANTQSQHKIQQLNKTIQMGPFASTGLESEMMETETEEEQPVNPSAIHNVAFANYNQDLKSLLHQGVQKWIDNKEIRNELKYQEWYQIIKMKMERDSVHEYEDFMFVKIVKKRQHKAIRLVLLESKNFEVCHDGLVSQNDKLILIDAGDRIRVAVCTDKYAFDNSNGYICHLNEGLNQIQRLEHKGFFNYNLDDSMEQIEDVIMCVKRKPAMA